MRDTEGQGLSSGASNLLSLPISQPQQRLPGHIDNNIILDSWPIDTQSSRHQVPEQLQNITFGDPRLSPSLLRRNTDSFLAIANDGNESAARWQQDVPWFSRNPFLSPDVPISSELDDGMQGSGMNGISSEDLNFDLLGSLGILTQNRITPGQITQQSPFSAVLNTPASTESPDLRIAPSTGNPSTDQNSSVSGEVDVEAGKNLHDAVKASQVQDLSTSSTTRPKFGVNDRLQSCPFHKLHTDDDLICMVRNYPRVMVRPGVYPPFVHHKLYRCAAGDIAEPLAKAFCCVGAFYASVPTSETFVYALINEESNKLVKGFVSSDHLALHKNIRGLTLISINGLALTVTCWQ